MRRGAIIMTIATAVTVLAGGCSSTPKHVIPPEKMAQLLADMYTAESIVDINRTKFMTDSMKKVMKQSVYARHGVTAEQVDTSFSWYGHHIEEYIKVYDRVVEILEEDIAQAASSNAAFGVEGDSVDTWQWSRYYEITRRSPSQVISFNLPKDDNWQKGDIYAWSIKFINNRTPMKWGISAEYPDGKVEYAYADVNGEGWSKLQFISDSTQVPTRIAGYLISSGQRTENMYLDSISLIRDRLKTGVYHQRYRQRSLKPRKQQETSIAINAERDSADNPTTHRPLSRRDIRNSR